MPPLWPTVSENGGNFGQAIWDKIRVSREGREDPIKGPPKKIVLNLFAISNRVKMAFTSLPQ
jgi:hypothetical protein